MNSGEAVNVKINGEWINAMFVSSTDSGAWVNIGRLVYVGWNQVQRITAPILRPQLDPNPFLDYMVKTS